MEEDLVVVGSNTMDFVITDLVVLNKKDKVPPDYVVVDQYISEGGMLSYTKRYLAYSRKIPNPRLGRVAVSDIKVIPSEERAPHGYRLLQWTLDDNSKSFSSKTVAIKLDPLERATQVVTDVVVLSGSKKDQVPSGFSRLPEINGYSICYKISQMNKGGETQSAGTNKQQQQQKTDTPSSNNSQPKKVNSAIDGLKFKLCNPRDADQNLSKYVLDAQLKFLSLDDIEEKFQFDWGLAEEQLAQS